MAKIKKKHVIIGSCVLAVAVGGVLLGASANTDATETALDVEEDAGISVEVQNPVHGDITVSAEFIATVDPDQQVTVYPKASGEVLEVMVSAGDTVQAGDVLLKIDSKSLEYTIAQSQAAVSSAQAKANYSLQVAQKDLETHEFNRDEGYDSALLQAEAAVKNAEKALETANYSAHTARRTLKDHRDEEDTFEFSGLNNFDALETQYKDAVVQAEINQEKAQLALEQAQENLRAAKMLNQESRENASNRVTQAELNTNFSDQYIAIQKLQEDLKNYTVTAPISGVVEQRTVEPYTMASPQSPVLVISNKDIMTISMNVSETALNNMAVGDPVTLEKNGETCIGEIVEISTMVDARSGLFTVKARVERPPFQLLSGSSVKVYVDAEKAKNDLLVPIDAIYYESGEPFVYVVRDGVAVKTYVQTGISDETRIQILDGVTAGDSVITSWNPNLTDGALVTVYEDSAQASPVAEEESDDTSSSSRGEAD